MEELERIGIAYRAGYATGVVGTIYGSKVNGPTIGIRADMDALPIQDERKSNYSSRNPGVMHACGHDAHMAILIGTAEVLYSLRNEIPGNIRLIFQPAEETVGGARGMIEGGALEDPEVNALIGLHVDETLNTGCIGIKFGCMNAASNPFEITIYGRAAHGAYPHMGVDAVSISSCIITMLQTILGREKDPMEPAVITIGTINGGSAPNVICDKVRMQGILRTINSRLRVQLSRRIKDLAGTLAGGMNGRCDFVVQDGYPCLVNDDSMVDLLKEASLKHIDSKNLIVLERPSLGVEDFAYYCQHVPSVFYKLGCRNKTKGIMHNAHGPLFDVDDDSVSLGTRIQCQMAVDFLMSAWR
jgi:amidohydrolase